MFLKKIKKNTQRYHYFTPAHQKSWWYDLLFLRYRVWQTEIGNFGSVFALLPPKNLKNQNFEKMGEKNCWRFYTCVPNTQWLSSSSRLDWGSYIVSTVKSASKNRSLDSLYKFFFFWFCLLHRTLLTCLPSCPDYASWWFFISAISLPQGQF